LRVKVLVLLSLLDTLMFTGSCTKYCCHCWTPWCSQARVQSTAVIARHPDVHRLVYKVLLSLLDTLMFTGSLEAFRRVRPLGQTSQSKVDFFGKLAWRQIILPFQPITSYYMHALAASIFTAVSGGAGRRKWQRWRWRHVRKWWNQQSLPVTCLLSMTPLADRFWKQIKECAGWAGSPSTHGRGGRVNFRRHSDSIVNTQYVEKPQALIGSRMVVSTAPREREGDWGVKHCSCLRGNLSQWMATT